MCILPEDFNVFCTLQPRYKPLFRTPPHGRKHHHRLKKMHFTRKTSDFGRGVGRDAIHHWQPPNSRPPSPTSAIATRKCVFPEENSDSTASGTPTPTWAKKKKSQHPRMSITSRPNYQNKHEKGRSTKGDYACIYTCIYVYVEMCL